MPISRTEEPHLQRALDLAQAAVGLASPNPTVGCVLVSPTGEVLGEGAHHYDALDHAEIVALKQAASLGHSVAGATAYVTLEPCAHHGRTGPCADALVAARIARCVVAAIDPNPLTRNNGLARMRDAGITVDVANRSSLQAIQARELNDAFAYSIQHHGYPFVTLKAALSVDGKLAPAPATRASIAPHWLTGEAARADAQHLRHAADAILTGIGTVLADDPTLTDRTNLPRRRPLLRIVLDADLRLPLTSKLITTAADDVLILCRTSAPQAAQAALEQHPIRVHRLADDSPHLDLHAVLDILAGQKIQSLLIEAGAAINGSFLRDDLVHKVVLYFAESELGPDAIPFSTTQPSPFVLQERLTQTTRTTFPHDNTSSSEDIRITGYLHGPWNNHQLPPPITNPSSRPH